MRTVPSIAVLVLSVATLVSPTPARAAYSRMGVFNHAAGSSIPYKINSTSFANGGLVPVTQLIREAAAAWNNDAPGNVHLTYAGDCPATSSCCVAGTWTPACGHSLVSYVPSGQCQPTTFPRDCSSTTTACGILTSTNCSKFLITLCGMDAGGATINWSLWLPGASSLDLVTVMVHEFGHALDFGGNPCSGHPGSSSLSVMDATQGSAQGNTKYRQTPHEDGSSHLSGYGSRQDEVIHTSTSTNSANTTWGPPATITYTWDDYGVVNQVGTTAGYQTVGGARVWQPTVSWTTLLAADYPLQSMSTTGTNQYLAGSGDMASRFQSPSLANHIEDEVMIAAWSKFESATQTAESRKLYAALTESGSFYGATPYDVTYSDDNNVVHSVKSYYSPGIAYDFFSKRFVMVWTNYSPDCPRRDATNMNCESVRVGGSDVLLYDKQILVINSASGADGTWSNVMLANQDFTSTRGPAIACENSSRFRNCVVANAGTDPDARIWMFSLGFFSGGGLAGVGSSNATAASDWSILEPALAFGGDNPGTFVLTWKSGVGAVGTTKTIWEYTFTLTGAGDISWGTHQELTSLITRAAPSINSWDANDGDARKMLIFTN